MATYEYLDQTGLQYTLNKLKLALNNIYVGKEVGKGLSTNDLTNQLLSKLNGIAANATQTGFVADYTTGNKIGTITIDDVDIDIYVPQGQSITIDSEMSDFSTNPVQNKVIKGYVDDAIEGVVGVQFKKVSVLPSVGEAGVIYLLAKSGTPVSQNIYEEYIWIASDNAYEKIGETTIDLSNYVQKTDLGSLTSAEIDTVFNAVFPSV